MEYHIRAAVFDGINELLTQRGHDPSDVFAPLGLSKNIAAQADKRVPYLKFLKSLHLSAEVARCESFGLLLSSYQELSVLGELAKVMQHAATVGDGLRGLIKYLTTHTNALEPSLEIADGTVRCSVTILELNAPGLPVQVDLIASTVVLTLRRIIGPKWSPDIVQLSRRRPNDLTPYSERFRCQLHFDQEFNAIEFPTSDLSRPIQSANARLYSQLRASLEKQLAKIPDSFSRKVRIALLLRMDDESTGIDDIAKSLGMSRRSLQRRLHQEGGTFSEIRQQHRNHLASHFLQFTDLDVTAISEALGYSQVSAFSRAFQDTYNVSPREYRRKSRQRE